MNNPFKKKWVFFLQYKTTRKYNIKELIMKEIIKVKGKDVQVIISETMNPNGSISKFAFDRQGNNYILSENHWYKQF